MTKPLPKSLHTITAIQCVARELQRVAGAGLSNSEAVDRALEVLGYSSTNDPYGLGARALKVLDASK